MLEEVIKGIISFFAYWLFSLIPKKKNLWVFSGFRKIHYMDNTKYLYEYIVKNHPEIEVIWLTKNEVIKNHLKKANMPVCKMNSIEGIWIMSRALIAFTDHFKMSDYTNRYGCNARTKIVNLWHGVGIKNMLPKGCVVPNTEVPGVRLSSDIIIQKNDNIIDRVIKFLKYPFIAPYREFFEKYFLICCPSQVFIDTFAAPLKTSESSRFLCGFPRNILSFKNRHFKNEKFSILYAPTYRWDLAEDELLVNNLIKNIEKIDDFLKSVHGEFVLRLHPIFLRNFDNNIKSIIDKYPNFRISSEQDIYTELYKYSAIITDYSSIVQDFLIFNRPIVYYAFDRKQYFSKEGAPNMPYDESCAGDITYTWEETLNSLKKSYNNVNYNVELRNKIKNMFCPEKYNSENNSENIVLELKKRLKI